MNRRPSTHPAQRPWLLSGRASLLAIALTTTGACATDDIDGGTRAPNALPTPPVADSGADVDSLQTTEQSLVDLTRNAPEITAWLTDSRSERHARADAFYDAAYNGGDLGGRTLRVVTTTADSGAGSLRDIIAQTDAAGAVIAFDTTVFPPDGVTVIRLQSPLQGVGPFFPGGVITRSSVTIVAPTPGAVVLDGDADNDGDGDIVLFDWMLTSGSFYRALTLVGLELRNGFSPDLALTPVLENGGPVVMVDCWVHDNLGEFPAGPDLCPTAGGAVRQVTASDGGGLVVFRSVFNDNESQCFGGAVTTDAGLIAESIFTRNTAAREGGAVYQWQAINGGLLFDSVTITRNQAGVAGGGIDLQSRFCEVRQSVIVGNSAPLDPDVQTIDLQGFRSVFGQAPGFTLLSPDGTSFFNEDPATVGGLEFEDAYPYPMVDLRQCSAAVDLGDPADTNPRDARAAVRPFDLTIGPPATNITDAGAAEAYEEFEPCPFVQPVIAGAAAVAADLSVTTAPVWRHPYGSVPTGIWQRCLTATLNDCVDIADTSGTSYTVRALDFGRFIRFRSTLDNQVAEDSMFSNRIGPILGTVPSFGTDPTVTGDPVRCGRLNLSIGELLGVPLPTDDDVTITWRTCDSSDVCTDVESDSLFYDVRPGDVGLRVEVEVSITTLAGTISVTVNVGTIGDTPPPVCTITEITYDSDADEFSVEGTATASGACDVDSLEVTQPGAPPVQPGQINIAPDGGFSVDLDGNAAAFDTFRCRIADSGGEDSQADYTAVVGDCTDAGVCNQTTNDCTVAVNESGPCGTAADACQSSTCAAGVCNQTFTTCDDSNLCTTDTCDIVTGCVFTNNTLACDDGNACTTTDVCAAGACAGSDPVVCTTENPCQTSACDTGTGNCVEAPVADDTPCDDTDVCNGDETCQAGACTSGSDLDCDTLDPGPCEATICDATNGCEIVVLDDDTPCNSDTICGGLCAAGLCEGGVEVDCTSDDPCQTGVCDEDNFECVFTPIDGCGEDVGVDAGPDAGTDAGADATSDADTGFDAETTPDVQVDADTPPDVQIDSATDTGQDTETDAVEDTSADTGTDVTEEPTIEGYLAGTGLIGCSSAPTDRRPAPVALCALVGLALMIRRRRS